MEYFKAHLTDKHQIKAADELISKLRIELGQEKSYSDELKEEINQLNKEKNALLFTIDQLKTEVKKIKDRYSSDVNNTVKLDTVYQKQQSKILKLEEDLSIAKSSRDAAIIELVKLREEYEGNTSKMV